MRVDPTVTASTMITRFYCRHKVRCHNWAVEILDAVYLLDKAGPVRVNEGWTKVSFRDRVA